MALALASSTLAFAPQLYVAAPAPTVQFRAAPAPVMTESRRAALLGLAAVAVPAVANAATPVWGVSKDSIVARSTKKAADTNKKIKCQVDKPCAVGAGFGWDPKALGVAVRGQEPKLRPLPSLSVDLRFQAVAC